MKNCILFIWGMLMYVNANAQYLLNPIDSIGIKQGSNWLQYPLAGGLNAPQFLSFDFNVDGTNDLLIFDRVGNTLIPFINTGAVGVTSYRYAPQYKSIFPDLYDWLQFADYNCDGVMDIFTSAGDSIRVLRGTNLGGNLSWALASDRLRFFNPSTSAKQAIFVKDVDLPACVDADGDGDIDVLTFDASGSYMELYTNQSIENGNNCDSLQYVLSSTCWGSFLEPSTTNFCNLNIMCRTSGAATSNDNLHPGSSTLAFDYDNNGTMDILIGDIAFNNMNLLLNNNVASAFIAAQDTAFPSNDITVDCYNFPAAYEGDFNNDGINDLVVSPSSEASNDNDNSAMYYQNNGTSTAPLYELQTTTFIQNKMLDLGEGCFPAAFDVDSDGDNDLIIGNFNTYVPPGSSNYARLAYLQNTGTAATPAYIVSTTDWLNLSSFSPVGAAKQSFIPTFGDLDNDGDKDLLVGEYSGSMYYFRNDASPGGPANFIFVSPAYNGIDVGQCAAPQLIDVNRDDLLDLLIGERNGNLNYYQNQGTATLASFPSATSALFGGVNVQEPLAVTGYAMPCLINQADNTYMLVVGSESGKLYSYTNIDGNLSGTFTQNNDFINLKCGKKTAPMFMNLDADANPELLVGNYRGGFQGFDIANWTGIADVSAIAVDIYPNPTIGNVHVRALDAFDFEVFDATGRLVLGESTQRTVHDFSIEKLLTGMYFIQLNFKNEQVIKKIIKI
jgi:hypothetical protein